MQGNTTFRHQGTVILSVEAADAPIVVPSSQFDEALSATYERLGLRPGLLEEVAGVIERRWWPEDVSYADAAALAGERAIQVAGIDRSEIGLLVDTSVCRSHLEPSAAVDVHRQLSLPSSCLNFDLANACLGFVNAMHLAATMIDGGQIRYALIVDGEGSRALQEATLARLARPETTVADVFAEFASLTLGSGGAAMVLGPADAHPDGHRLVGGESRAGTEFNDLCVGSIDHMRTDTKALLDAGLQVADATWIAARDNGWDWGNADHYILHQISSVHTQLMCKQIGIDPERAPLTFPHRGNIGPASIPTTLALHQDQIRPGDTVVIGGIGSGINTLGSEIRW
ncbi:MAG: 3-oxoacyl-ACP synthase III [Nitriliruptor sp.]|nr:MAG: 3-oxoacyl-ACP synthase III [Nitriliruptor sp.]